MTEVAGLLSRLHGTMWLMASLLYGGGLRLLECVELRVKDVQFDRGELTIRDGKGGKDRVTMLPALLRQPLGDHLTRVKAQHDADLAAGRGAVALPGALRLKYPGAPFEWGWQWVFPATRFYRRCGDRRAEAASSARVGVAAGGEGGGAGGGPRASCQLSHASTFVCHAFA